MKCDFLQTRILSVFNLMKWVGFAVLLLGGNAIACGPDWTNLSAPPWGIQNVVLSIEEESEFICGTARDFFEPTSGGVFRRRMGDTTWVFSGLEYHTVYELRRFEFNPCYIFAPTSEGLYRSVDDGHTWELLTTIGSGGLRDQVSFAISSFDSTMWILGAVELGVGMLYVSHNSGGQWNQVEIGAASRDIEFSVHVDGIVFAAGSNFTRYVIDADSEETLYEFAGQTVNSIERHISSPWIYFCTEDTVGKFDEVTGELILVPSPSTGWNRGLTFVPPDSLLIGAEDGLFMMDEHLQNSRNVSDGISGNAKPMFATDLFQASLFGRNLYCRSVPTSVSRDRDFESYDHSMFSVYPNPFNSTISISLEIPLHQEVTISLYDLLGREVEVIQRGRLESAMLSYSVPPSLASGIYFVRAATALDAVMQKIVLLK